MLTTRVEARAVQPVASPDVATDPGIVRTVLQDASHFPGGHAIGVVRPRSEEEVAAALREAYARGVPVLPIGAQSSLTGGAVPMGDLVISLQELNGIGKIDTGVASGTGASLNSSATVWVGPGARLKELKELVELKGWEYPPAPTYQLACVGGTVATNAAGAATYKYGTTRKWVRGLRVLTVDGYLLELERGDHTVEAGGTFEIALPNGELRRVPAPKWTAPGVKKTSMGYHSAPSIDLIDLFIGSEGTLGVITAVKLALMRPPPAVLSCLVFMRDEAEGKELATALRQASEYKRSGRAGSAIDVRAMEHMDAASLELVRTRGLDFKLKIPLPKEAKFALFFEVELAEKTSGKQVLADLDTIAMGSFAASTAGQLFQLLSKKRALPFLELAMPDEPSRLQAFREFREAIPMAVNETIGERKALFDPEIAKLGGDMCVPYEKLGVLMAFQKKEFESRGLEYCVFGHISDGNIHPNILAKSKQDMEKGREALLAVAAKCKELGGSPLSEHGVGRNPLKQEMMKRYHGVEVIEQMRVLKLAIDPKWRLSRGVLFPAPAM